MATRPVFLATDDSIVARRIDIEFIFYNGLSEKQKQRSIKSLHDAFEKAGYHQRVLEVSTYSLVPLGVQLSAFNLMIDCKSIGSFSVESAFQASKVFEMGGPYADILRESSKKAKGDIRLRNSGKLVKFVYFDKEFPLIPKTYFYMWLYINALAKKESLADMTMDYSAFTDIAFNPDRQINCQAEAIATYVSLRKKGLLHQALKSRTDFCYIVFEQQDVNFEQISIF